MRAVWQVACLGALAAAGCASEAPETRKETGSAETRRDDQLPSANESAAPETPPARQLPPSGSDQPLSQTGYRLIGTEPFWGGTVAKEEVIYSTPENQEGDKIAVAARFDAGREIYAGTLSGKAFVLTLTAGPCSDGMSDNVHAYTASLQVGGETRQGCADPR